MVINREFQFQLLEVDFLWCFEVDASWFDTCLSSFDANWFKTIGR